MTAPSDDSEPRRAATIPAVVASLALHAAALAAVIAGTSERAPHPPGRLPDIAVDIVAPPAPDTVETVATVVTIERPTGEPPAGEPPVAAVQNAEAPPEPPAPVASPPEASDTSDAAPPVPIPAVRPPAPAPSRKPKPAPPQAASTPASRPLGAAPEPAGPAAVPPTGPTVAAVPLESPQPPYPAAARRRGQQGRVVLSVRVSPAGAPEAVVLVSSSGVEALDDAARDAVRGWRFRPALDKGTAVAATVEVPVRFRLEED